jgi:hypothetical protein
LIPNLWRAKLHEASLGKQAKWPHRLLAALENTTGMMR